MDKPPGAGYTWSMRVRWTGGQEATAYARNNTFTVGPPASFKATDPHPSAVEYLLGALGGDLTNGFQRNAEQRGVQLDALELALSGRLENPLVYLGVIGETGDPHLAEIGGTLYVSADAPPDVLQAVWQTTLERSPLANTLKRCITLSVELYVM